VNFKNSKQQEITTMSNNQTAQEKETKRARAMVIDINNMLKESDKAAKKDSCWDKDFDYENDWKKPVIAELDRQVKARLFETSERSWTMNDIYVFLSSLENELEKREKDTECFWKILKKHGNGNNCFDEDFRLCPFGMLYQAFLEIVFENAILINFFSRKFLAEKKQSEIEAEKIVREAKAKAEIAEDEKWQTINNQNFEMAINEAKAEMEIA
jgi:hypothetical protein